MANHCATDLGFLSFVCESMTMAVKVRWSVELVQRRNILCLGIWKQTCLVTSDDQFLFEDLVFGDLTLIVAEEEEKEEENLQR